jgi:Tat protein secretion system quality control protein TatD with DNase activity
MPLDSVFTETDGAEELRWLTGGAGVPHHLLDVLRALADLRGLSIAELTAVVAANWRQLCAGDARLAPWTEWQ